MANSGIMWIDAIFNWSVRALYEIAGRLGMTYEEINVWLFCIAWPVITLLMMVAIFWLWHDNRTLRRQVGLTPEM